MELMLWILLLSVIWGTIKIGYRLYHYHNFIHLAFFLSILSLSVNVVAELIYQNINSSTLLKIEPNLVGEWAKVSSIAFILCGLSLIIRLSKPVFARFPIPFAALPLLIIATYPMAIETVMIKKWLLGIYEGGALVASLLIFIVKLSRDKSFNLLLISTVLFTGAYIIYWFQLLPSGLNQYWYLIFALGVYLSISGLDSAYPLGLNENGDTVNVQLDSSVNTAKTGLEQ